MSGVMPVTEFGVWKSAVTPKPASCTRPCIRSPTTQTLRVLAQRPERLGHKLCEAFVELSDHALIGAEDDRADSSPGDGRRGEPGLGRVAKAGDEAEFDRAAVIGERDDGALVGADARGGHSLHRPHDGMKVVGAFNLSAQDGQCFAHGPLGTDAMHRGIFPRPCRGRRR